jgi:tRNA modification GTPase
MHDLSTTLVAVATAPGRGGLGCVRLSGERAHEIARALFRAHGPPRGLRFGVFLDEAGQRLDHGYLVEFEPERSFTAEPSAELWAHGSPPVLAALVRAAAAQGAVPAGPGEFTYRALRRGRLDLPRAEAIRDLIAARTLEQARSAFSQVEGATARRVAPLRELLVDLAARAEAAVEFVDEADVAPSIELLVSGTARALTLARELLEEARRGRVLREGLRVAICGAPSVGKSSLFNRILGLERAIVSPIPGTTRDTLEETLDLDGVPVTLVDTAGLRPVEDPVEAEGVRRAHAAAAEADLTLLVLDATRELTPDEARALDRAAARRTLVIANKVDLLPSSEPPRHATALPVSVRTGLGWDAFRETLRGTLTAGGAGEAAALTNIRHALALERVAGALARGHAAARDGLSDEAVLVDLRDALDGLAEITGDVGTEELYDRIFATFCIGK